MAAQISSLRSRPESRRNLPCKQALGNERQRACAWWGIALVAAETGIGAIGLVGVLVMTVLLRRVSGAYVARTSPFVPRRPRG